MKELVRINTADGLKIVRSCFAKGPNFKLSDLLRQTTGPIETYCKNRRSPNIDTAAGRELVLKTATKGGTESFGEHLKRILQDPIQPLDDNGRYRLHPLLMSAIAYGVLALGVFAYFTFFSK